MGECDTYKQTLIIATLGPVQEFIAQARKMRDLWFGSHLLSELSKAAASKFEEMGGKLIFPQLDRRKDGTESAVANKIIGLIRTDEPQAIALAMRRAVEDKWKTYTLDAEERLGKDKAINVPMWKRQVKDVLEFYAAWSSLKDDSQYAEVRDKTERLLAARKTLRDFKPNEPSKLFGDKKSALDSGRESVLLESKFHRYAHYGIKKDETLDAISLVKRLSSQHAKQDPFYSVCDTAFQPFRDRMASNLYWQESVQQYYDAAVQICKRYVPSLLIREDGLDSRFFYEKQIRDMLQETDLDSEQMKLICSEIFVSLNELYSQLRERPSPYYAFLLADGDRMGQKIKAIRSPEAHRAFTRQLSLFSEEAGKIVTKHQGQLIYSGGDDVMAVLPLHTCFVAVQALYDQFAADVGEAIPLSEGPVTLSAGMVIVHMLEPLGEVRILAQQAEQMAKERRGQLAVFMQKRSGGELMRYAMSFDEQPDQRMARLVEMYRTGIYSAQLAYDLRELYLRYHRFDSPWVESEEFRSLLFKEIERTVTRKQQIAGSGVKEVEALLSEIQLIFNKQGKPLKRLELLAELLVLAVTLGKSGDADA